MLNSFPILAPGNVVDHGHNGGEENEPGQSVVVELQGSADCKVSFYGDREGEIGRTNSGRYIYIYMDILNLVRTTSSYHKFLMKYRDNFI